jgi:hypothetical protein
MATQLLLRNANTRGHSGGGRGLRGLGEVGTQGGGPHRSGEEWRG